MFYSVSSTQKGLAGIDLGNFLIKQVHTRCRITAVVCPGTCLRRWLVQVQRSLASFNDFTVFEKL